MIKVQIGRRDFIKVIATGLVGVVVSVLLPSRLESAIELDKSDTLNIAGTPGHWALHIQAAMSDNPSNAQLQRQGTAILTSLATIRENARNWQVRSELDSLQAARTLNGRNAVERNQIRSWLTKTAAEGNHPTSLALSLEEIRV